MAVPSSGAISLAKIRDEIENNDYNANIYGYTSGQTSLEDISDGTYDTINTQNASADRPDGTAPHSMSEFYAYDHDLSSLTQKNVTSGASLSSSSAACTAIASTAGYFSNLNSSGVPVAYSSYMYSNSSGTSTFAYGWRSFGPGFLPTHAIRAQSSGLVTHVVTCSGGFPSDRSLKKNINLIGLSPKGLNIYSFEYKDSKVGQGLFRGVMADEVEHIKDAVVIDANGYKRVNYSIKEIDVEFDAI
jgi:hypothetical protein